MQDSMTVHIAIVHPTLFGGGGLWVEALESLMEEQLAGFGSALSELEFTASFATELPPLHTFEDYWPKYHDSLKQLPKARFLRKKQSFRLELFASFALAEDSLEPQEGQPTPPLLRGQPGLLRKVSNLRFQYLPALTKLIVSNLDLMRQRLNPQNEFDFTGFINAARGIEDMLPQTIEEAESLAKRRQERLKLHSEADPWFGVDVDWDDFHPNSRELLDDPWYWDSADDWAPHGNDAGFDLLQDLQEYDGDTLEVVHRSLKEIGMDTFDWPAMDAAAALEIAESDAQMYYTICEQTFIAAAFAEIKLKGTVDGDVYDLAATSIDRLSTSSMLQFWAGHLDESQQDEWKKRLAQMSAKLHELGHQ